MTGRVIKNTWSGKGGPEGVVLNLELRLTDIEQLTEMRETVYVPSATRVHQTGYPVETGKTVEGPPEFKCTLTPEASTLVAAAMAVAVRQLREEQIVSGLRGLGELDLALAGRRAIAFGFIEEKKK